LADLVIGFWSFALHRHPFFPAPRNPGSIGHAGSFEKSEEAGRAGELSMTSKSSRRSNLNARLQIIFFSLDCQTR
jgi:hypothetical protein